MPRIVKIKCSRCAGKGVISNGGNSPFETHNTTCPQCHGATYIEGELIEDGQKVEEPHAYDDLIKPRDGSHDVGQTRPY